MKYSIAPVSLTRTQGSLFNRLGIHNGLGPLTARGVLVLALLAYLFWFLVHQQTDIVVASFGFGLLSVVAATALYISIHGIVLQRSVEFSVHPPEDAAVSGTPSRFVLHTTPLRVWPLALFDIVLEFEQQTAPHVHVRLSGVRLGERRLVIDVPFRHRGVWEVRSIRCEVRDPAGLAKYVWNHPVTGSITIVPPELPNSTLPILSSSQRPGDLVVDTLNRHGDLYDIKPYHPSDGIRRIVWKTFAKRGELLSRHPEASMTPEGFVVIFVLAGPDEDEVCSNALAYISMLEEVQLDLVVGTEGAHGRSPARQRESAQTLLIDSVWDSYKSSGDTLTNDLSSLLDYCGQVAGTSIIDKVIVFASARRLATQAPLIRELGGYLNKRSISPVFCVTPASSLVPEPRRGMVPRIMGLFVAPQPVEAEVVSRNSYSQFLALCADRRWEVYV